MQTEASFWNKMARGYAKRPVKDVEAYEMTLDRVRQYLGADDKALELGCGTGTTGLKLADTGASITATDVASEMIVIAREKAQARDVPNVTFEVAGATGMPGSAGYDVVMAFNLLHLLDDLPGTLRYIHETLAEGGLFISKTPCIGPKKWMFGPMIAAMRFFGKAPYVAYLYADALEASVREAGFEIVETGDYPQSTGSRFIVARKL